jgi:hypothetical protein
MQQRGVFAVRAYYDHPTPPHTLDQEQWIWHMCRTLAIDEMVDLFRRQALTIPSDARSIGRLRNGFGDYYRQMMAMQRTMERDAQGNWVSRWLDHGKDDHYAHAEVYCVMAFFAWQEVEVTRYVSFDDLVRAGFIRR